MTASTQTTTTSKCAPESNGLVDAKPGGELCGELGIEPTLDVNVSDAHWLAASLATPLDARSKVIRKQIIRVLLVSLLLPVHTRAQESPGDERIQAETQRVLPDIIEKRHVCGIAR